MSANICRPRASRAGALILALAIAFVAAACSDDGSDTEPPGVNTTGNVETETLDVGRYLQKIDAGNGWLVELTADPTAESSAQITFNSEDKDKVSAEYRRGTLTLRTATGTELSSPPTAILTVIKLTDARLSGGAKIEATGTFTGSDFDAELNGGSNLSGADANLGVVTMTASDQSQVTFSSGSMNALTITATGNSGFELAGVSSNSITAALTDTSTATVGISNALTVTASGDSKLTYGGNPQVSQNLSDAAKIEAAAGASGN